MVNLVKRKITQPLNFSALKIYIARYAIASLSVTLSVCPTYDTGTPSHGWIIQQEAKLSLG